MSPGKCKTVAVDNRYIAVFNVDGTFHALYGKCPHKGGMLGNGTLTGCVVKCPEHGMRFDVTTGVACDGGLRADALAVKVEGGDVLVAVESTQRGRLK